MFFKSSIGIMFFIILLICGMTSLFYLNDIDLSQIYSQISISNIADGSLLDKIEKKVNNTFPLKESFIEVKANIDNLFGRIEYNDIYVTDNSLFVNPIIKNQETLDNNINAINKFSQKYSANSNIKIMIVPTALEFAKKSLPKYISSIDQNKVIKEIYQKLPLIGFVDAYYALSPIDYNYIFYKTHNSWTSLGSYHGYRALSRSLGYRPISIDLFDIEHISYDFVGNMSSKANIHPHFKDTIDIYYYSIGDTINQLIIDIGPQQHAVSSMFFKEYINKPSKHNVFLGEDANIITIDTILENNKKLLIFKDELSDTLIQFLSIHFQQITLIDLNLFTEDILDVIDMSNYQQVLLLYDFDNFINNKNISNIINF